MSASTQFPTIKTFFASVAPQSKHTAYSSNLSWTPSRDKFTSSELTRELSLDVGIRTPPRDYQEVTIAELAPGPRRVIFNGNVVNIFDHSLESKSSQAARGCLKLLVKDDTGEILVKLWYATTSYSVLLGTSVKIWTTHIHPTTSSSNALETLTSHPSSIVTSIFPERDNGCCIKVFPNEVKLFSEKTPPGYATKQVPNGLMSLENFAAGGSEIPGAKVLVCVVAIGPAITTKTKAGSSFTTLSIGVRDTSATTPYTLIFTESLVPSAALLMLNITTLLITSPRLHPFKPQTLTLTSCSQIDINPRIPESLALHKFILRETCPINQPFPEDIFDVEIIESSPLRLRFTFADLVEFIKANPDQIYAGYLSVILTRIDLRQLISKKQLFSMECCSMPLYANTATSTCDQCGQSINLLLNPNLIGEIADETGAISTSADGHQSTSKSSRNRLLVRPQAFTDLLGRAPEDLAAMCDANGPAEIVRHNRATLKLMEDRLAWMRVTILVGWTGAWGGGRLALLRVVGETEA